MATLFTQGPEDLLASCGGVALQGNGTMFTLLAGKVTSLALMLLHRVMFLLAAVSQ